MAAKAALDASARGQTRISSRDRATVNPLNIYDAHVQPTRAGALGRQFLLPTELADASETVDGAADTKRAAIEDVRVHHRRADVSVAQQLLHRSNVVAVLEQVYCE